MTCFAPDSALVTEIVAAVNAEPRRLGVKPTLLILHYTGMLTAAAAVRWLACAESRVSCHYVIDEHGRITQLVPEALRAWHAGVSMWRQRDDINSHSIGIEIQNPGHEHGYPDFPAAQMAAVSRLTRDIIKRHAMSREAVLAHSDIAPGRKIDPGEKFDWSALAAEGVGHWVRPAPLIGDDGGFGPGDTDIDIRNAQYALHDYGYNVPLTGTLDEATSKVIRAFQLHFRPTRCDGRLDRSTLSTLEALVSAREDAAVS